MSYYTVFNFLLMKPCYWFFFLQEPGDLSSQPCGMSDNYYVEGGDLEGYNSYEGCDGGATDVHASYVNVISRDGHGSGAAR